MDINVIAELYVKQATSDLAVDNEIAETRTRKALNANNWDVVKTGDGNFKLVCLAEPV